MAFSVITAVSQLVVPNMINPIVSSSIYLNEQLVYVAIVH